MNSLERSVTEGIRTCQWVGINSSINLRKKTIKSILHFIVPNCLQLKVNRKGHVRNDKNTLGDLVANTWPTNRPIKSIAMRQHASCQYRLFLRQNEKWRDQKEDWVVQIRAHHWRKNTEVAGTRSKNGGLQNTSSGYTVGTERIQEEAGMAKERLDGHCQTRSEGCGH